MSSDWELHLAEIARFEQQLEELQQRYNKLETRRTKIQRQLERLTQQAGNLDIRIDKYRSQLERVTKQQTSLLREQQQLEQLITLLKQQNEKET